MQNFCWFFPFPITRITLIGLLLLSLASGAEPAEPKMGGTLKFVPQADLKILDPIWTSAYITRNHGYMIYDTLFSLDENLKPQPQMVKTWQVSEDGLQYTFTLREGLKFHDGKPVVAEDVVASLKRWGQRDVLGKLLMDFTARLEAIDEKTFRLVLKEPFNLVLEALAKPSGSVPFIMPARIAATPADEQIKETIGSGPFKFVKEEWEPGHRVVYIRNPEYIPRAEPAHSGTGGKRVYVDRVEWIYIPDPATASAALEAGEVDFWENPPIDFVVRLKQNPQITVSIVDPLGTQGVLRPNHLHPPFNNVKARQALLWMVSQEIYMQAAIGDKNFWRTCPGFFICGGPWETDVGSEPLKQQNLEKARQLMKEAGYDGRPVVLMDPTDMPILHVATLVTQQLLTQIGVKVDLQAMDWSTLVSRRAEKKPPEEGGWNLFHTWSVGSDVMNPAVSSASSGACDKAWFGWYCSPRMEELRAEWVRTQDPVRQKQLVEEIQKLAFEEVPYVPFGQWFLPTAYRKDVKGVLQFPAPILWNIWLDR
ncbi:MAG TPA: ABC transporter substrate-binding protein [Candidatus Limnocylindrales bacterium]|nr:ABC transporter substrate-binding protein [Candidatus Limnocylindrales bacterium]